MSYTSLSDNELVHVFEGESRRQGLGEVDPLLCLELMRRAFVQKISTAFEAVEKYYSKLFLYWVWNDPAFRSLAERWGNDLAADVIQEAYANIFRTLRKLIDPGAFYDKFDSICRKFLGFVRMCLHSAIQDVRRDDHKGDADPPPASAEGKQASQRRWITPPPSLDAIPDTTGAADDTGELRFGETLSRVRSLLTQKQWHLFYCAYVYDMRPREIAVSYPGLGMTARDIAVALYAIRRRLKGDNGLRDMLT